MSSSCTCRNEQGALLTAVRLLMAVPAIVCFGTAAWAVDPDRAMSQYLHDRWESDRGFPGGAVHAITQTTDGYLWIATEKGLVRFDGVTFRLMQPPGVTSGNDSTVLGLAADPAGGLLVQLRSALLVRYRGDEFDESASSTVPPDSAVTAMARGNNGAVIVSAMDHGVIINRDARSEILVTQRAMPSSFVISIAQTPDGDVWLGTRDSGLLRVHDGRVTAITKGLPDQKINSLLAGEHQDLWIGTDNGVVRWNGTAVTRTGLPDALEHVAALAMVKDRDSNVWIASTAGGLLRVNDHGLARLEERDPDPRGTVTTVFEDRDGNMWIGTSRGIERLRDGVFTTYSAAQGLPSGSYGSVFAESDRIWIAPVGGGLFWLRQGHLVRVRLAGLDQEVVYSISGSPGEVWLARQRGGLTRIRAEGDTVTATSFTKADGLAQNNVYAVQRARDGSVWAGTLSGGVSRLKDGVFTTYTTDDGLTSNTVAAILEAADGTIWFATPNGVSAFSRGTWRRYAVGDGLPSNDVNTIFEDSHHDVWIGTAAGLARFESGHMRSFAAPPQLRASILGMAEDGRGWLWLATSDHVLRINRERLALGSFDESDVRAYGAADGLLGIEGVKRHRSLVADPRGRIWLAVNRGLSMADPVRSEGRVGPALVHVEDVSADGSSVNRAGEILIPPRQHRITLTYTGLSLSVPERVKFRYRLDGFDRDWGGAASAREAVYTNLGPGEYQFRVIASNSDGVWNGSEATVRFRIQPAFWQTLWFRLAVVLLAVACGWGAYRLRVMQVARQLNVRFEERLAERTRIAQELHDTLLQGFLSASMQLHVTADRLPADSPAKLALGRVLDLMGRVIEEGRNAVRGLRSSRTASYDLEQAFSEMSEELAGDGKTDYRVIVEGKAQPLNPIIRDDVYKIGREALVNAFRHSGAGTIELELEYASTDLRMLVRDNGRGIDPQVLQTGSDGHWGLSGMRERAERIGGRFKVWSSATAGTEIELRVPGRVAYAQEKRS